MLADMVSALGHSVVAQVHDSCQSIEAIRTRNPTVVLLDVIMPGMDGFAVLSQIQNLRRDIKVVMVTGEANDSNTIKQCLMMGAKDFLVKPVTRERLKTCLSKLPEPWEEQLKELGKLCSIGYIPNYEERKIMNAGRLGYLLYPSCHLALQFFKDKLKPDTNMAILVVKEGLPMYSTRQDVIGPQNRFDKSDQLEPWKQVIVEAQKSYYRFWKPAIRHGLIPPVVSCMVLRKGEEVPVFMGPLEILSIPGIEKPKFEEGDTPMDEAEGIGDPGKAVEWHRVADRFRAILTKIEARHPKLVKPIQTKPVEAPEVKPQSKIDTRPVKIVPDYLRDTEGSRMHIDR